MSRRRDEGNGKLIALGVAGAAAIFGTALLAYQVLSDNGGRSRTRRSRSRRRGSAEPPSRPDAMGPLLSQQYRPAPGESAIREADEAELSRDVSREKGALWLNATKRAGPAIELLEKRFNQIRKLHGRDNDPAPRDPELPLRRQEESAWESSGSSARLSEAGLLAFRRSLQTIDRDVPRTAPASRMDTTAGRKRVRRLLRIYAKHDPELGYVQGMSFIASRCLQAFGGDVADDTQQMMAFVLLTRIMQGPTLCFRSIVGANLQGVPRLYEEMEAVLRIKAPAVAAHFEQLQIKPALYVEWFLSLFHLPLRGAELDDAWTYLLEHGWPAAYAIATQMLIDLWPYMSGLDFSETMMVMKAHMQHWSIVDRVDARIQEEATGGRKDHGETDGEDEDEDEGKGEGGGGGTGGGESIPTAKGSSPPQDSDPPKGPSIGGKERSSSGATMDAGTGKDVDAAAACARAVEIAAASVTSFALQPRRGLVATARELRVDSAFVRAALAQTAASGGSLGEVGGEGAGLSPGDAEGAAGGGGGESSASETEDPPLEVGGRAVSSYSQGSRTSGVQPSGVAKATEEAVTWAIKAGSEWFGSSQFVQRFRRTNVADTN